MRVPGPKSLYQPTTPDTDKEGLKREKLGFVVLGIDRPSGGALYIDETGAEVAIEAFGTP